VEQTLSSLVSNAIKYSPRGGVVTLRADSEQGTARVAVSDEGVGISAVDVEHIWDPLVRARRNFRRSPMAEVLVVDDDDDVALLIEAFLEREGHRVRHASNGEQGLALLREALPDLLVMDIEMPILDGPGMAARMLVENAGKERVPILIVSGAISPSPSIPPSCSPCPPRRFANDDFRWEREVG
jgi:CheY-like chemotaxis protein